MNTDGDGFRNPPPSRARHTLVCLGDSTPFGWRVEADACFPRQLETILSPDSWRVINAGVPGYSSFQVRLQAERWIPRWKPDVIVVCVGNNEAWPVETSDRELHEQRRAARALTTLLSHSKFLVWLGERVWQQQPKPFIAKNLEATEPRVDPHDFEENIERIIDVAQRHRARVIVLGPPVNLYEPPLRLNQFVEWDRFMGYVSQIDRLLEQDKFAEAQQLVQQSVDLDPDGFWHYWLQGRILVLMNENDAARQILEQAFERHPYPERCKPSYQAILRRAADRHGLAFLDVNDLFHDSTNPKPPADLYLDWCHPTPNGHRLIAQAVAERL